MTQTPPQTPLTDLEVARGLVKKMDDWIAAVDAVGDKTCNRALAFPLEDIRALRDVIKPQMGLAEAVQAAADESREQWKQAAEALYDLPSDQHDNRLMDVTANWPEHPEDYELPCACELCVSYSDPD